MRLKERTKFLVQHANMHQHNKQRVVLAGFFTNGLLLPPHAGLVAIMLRCGLMACTHCASFHMHLDQEPCFFFNIIKSRHVDTVIDVFVVHVAVKATKPILLYLQTMVFLFNISNIFVQIEDPF